jgi:LCP family protein required for cell wall assembly
VHSATRMLLALLVALSVTACATPGAVRLSDQVYSLPALPGYDASHADDPYRPSAEQPAPVVTVAAEASTDVQPKPQQGRLTILVMGVDARETWSQGPPRTDAMMLISADLGTHTAVVLSIPRDLWVPIPGYGQERINVAYRVAELDKPGSGPAKACETVSAYLNVPIDRYAVLNFRAVREAIDALGGLEIEVPYEILDTQYPTDDNRYMTVHFLPGRQTMTGEQVLEYMRTRHGNSDFDRMRRQQQVLLALKSRVSQPDFLAKLPQLLRLARDSVNTNVSVSEMIALADAFRSVTPQAITFAVIDEKLAYPWVTVTGADVLLPNQSGIESLVTSLGLRQPAEEANLAQGLHIRLYASSAQDPGFAVATQALTDAGYDVWQGGIRDNPVGHTIVLDYSGGDQGQRLARALGLDSMQVLPSPRPPNLPADVVADILLAPPKPAQ